MLDADGTTPNLRDTIANAVEQHVAQETTVAPVSTETVKTEKEVTTEISPQRARDQSGKFSQKTEETPKPRPQRPSSWKKDYWNHWDKLNLGQALTPEEAMQAAEYTAQREQDYAKGVSTYKAEWDKAKPVLEVLNPISSMVQQHGYADTNHWLKTAVQTFSALTSGTPQQKLGTLFQIAATYKVPLEEVFEQAEDGRFYLNPQKFQDVQPRQAAKTPDVRQTIQEILAEERATVQVDSFAKDEKYPHLNQVRETMAGLLRAGLVEDLQGAYQAALNMPKHADLKASLQEAKQADEEAKKKAESVSLAANARAKVVSPRSSTPAQLTKHETGKGIRSAIEDAFNAKSGRV